MIKNNPAGFPAEQYQGKDLSTMDVSIARIGDVALTLEEWRAGKSVIAPETPMTPSTEAVAVNCTVVDNRDPRVPHSFKIVQQF